MISNIKKFTLVLCMAILSITIHVQTWKAQIETITIKGNHITKTLVMRPNHKINIISIVNPSYSRPIHYYGTFLGGSSDSIRINLIATDMQQSTYLKGKNFPGIEGYNKGNITLALSDVSYIHYRRLTENAEEYITGGTMLGILGSLTALTITPLFCINLKDMTFNTDRYKKWAVGGAIGLASSLTIIIPFIIIDDKKFHFKLDIPDKNINVWNFKYD